MAKKAGRMIVPWFNADRGWGDMEIFECGDEVVVVDTYAHGMIEARNRLLKILNGRKFSLFISHGHHDHNGDYEYYFKKGLVKALYISAYGPSQEVSNDKDRDAAMIALAKKLGIKIVYLKEPTTFTIGTGKFEILYVPKTGNNNTKSICMRVTLNGVRILLCGDATTSTIDWMLDRGIDISCDIVKLNHHGVKENNPLKFVKACKATYAFGNCNGETKNQWKSWAADSYNRYIGRSINMYGLRYNGYKDGLIFECQAGEVNVLGSSNMKTVTKEVTADGFTVKKQFHVCNKLDLFYKGSMKYVDLQLAKDVCCNRFGTGEDRVAALGKKYNTVQNIVNVLVETYVDRMIRGEGGNGEANRTKWLKECGFIYDPTAAYHLFQNLVNLKESKK